MAGSVAHRRWMLCLALIAGALIPLSTSAPSSRAEPPVTVAPSAGDAASALARAAATGRPVRVAALTTANREVNARPDGTFSAEVAAEPQRLWRDGGWVDLDTGLVPAGAGLRPLASPTVVDVSAGGSDALVTVRDGDRRLSLTWPSPLPAPTIVDGNAVYPLAAGIDLVVEASSTGFSFDVVVRRAEAAQNPILQQLAFGWSGVGVTLVRTATGFEARAADGEIVFAGPRPRMWDASDNLSAEVELSVDADQFTLSASRAWVTAPERTFPLTVDPSLDKYQDDWTMVWSDGQRFWNSTSEDHRVGYDGWSDHKKSRLFYAMSLAGLAHKHVLSATFSHSQYHSPNFDCNLKTYGPGVQLWRTGTITRSTRWSDQPTWQQKLATANLAHGNRLTCPGDSLTEWGGKDLTAAVQAASTAGQKSITFGLRSADESDRNGWRRFHRKDERRHILPKLVVTYNTVPVAPAGLAVQYARSYAGRWFVPDRTPLVSAAVADADVGQQLAARFTTTVARRVRTFTSAVTSSGGRAATQWPAIPDGSYAVSARAWDGIDWSGGSRALAFTVDGAAPAPPVITITANPQPRVGQRVTVSLDSPSPDVAGYRFGVGTSTPTTPYDLTPTTLGAARGLSFVLPRSGTNIVTARAVDRAGNLSAVARIEIKGIVDLPWDSYLLDGTGADVRQDGRTATVGPAYPLDVPTGTSWVTGRTGHPADLALDVRATSPVRQLAAAATEVDSSQSFTIGAWVSASATEATSAGFQAAAALTDGTSSAGSIGFYRSADGAGLQPAFVLDPSPTSTGARTWVIAPTAIPAGRWVHLVGVFNREAGTAELYVDASLAARAASVPIPFPATRIQVGQSPDGGVPQPFDGYVDAVRLYRGAAEDTAVQQYFRATS